MKSDPRVGPHPNLEAIGKVDRTDQLLVPGNCETVGHPGNEIADRAQPERLALPALPAVRQ